MIQKRLHISRHLASVRVQDKRGMKIHQWEAITIRSKDLLRKYKQKKRSTLLQLTKHISHWINYQYAHKDLNSKFPARKEIHGDLSQVQYLLCQNNLHFVCIVIECIFKIIIYVIKQFSHAVLRRRLKNPESKWSFWKRRPFKWRRATDN